MWEALAVGGSGLYPLAEGEDAGAAEQRRCLSYCAVALMAEADVVMTAITGTDPSLPAFRFIADPLLHHPDAHSFTSLGCLQLVYAHSHQCQEVIDT